VVGSRQTTDDRRQEDSEKMEHLRAGESLRVSTETDDEGGYLMEVMEDAAAFDVLPSGVLYVQYADGSQEWIREWLMCDVAPQVPKERPS